MKKGQCGVNSEVSERGSRRPTQGIGAAAANIRLMQGLDLDKLAGQVEPLTRFFYAMLGVALLAVLFGSPGSALFFLVVGSLAQVVRAAVQELLWQRQSEAPAPPRQRPASRPATQRAAARQAPATPRTARQRAALSR